MVVKCEKCGAMYILSDDKLKAQDWKLNCTKCQHVTQIKPAGEQKPTESAEGAQPSVKEVAPPESALLPAEIRQHLESFRQDQKSKSFLPAAEYYFKQEKFEEALKLLESGIRANPGYFSARILLGRALIKLGRMEEAVAELQRVCSQARDNTLAQKHLAIALKSLGRTREARLAIDIVKMLDPKDTEADEILNEIIAIESEPLKEGAGEPPVHEGETPAEEISEPPDRAQEEEQEIEEKSLEDELTSMVEESLLGEAGKEEPVSEGVDELFSAPEEESFERAEETERTDAELPADIGDFPVADSGETLRAEREAFGEPREEEPERFEEGAGASEEKIPEEDIWGEMGAAEPEPPAREEGVEEAPPTEEEIPVNETERFEEQRAEFSEEQTAESAALQRDDLMFGEEEQPKASEEKQEETVEGFESGRFDQGVTAEGVIEDVFKEEAPGAEIEIVVEERVKSEELPQIDEKAFAEARPQPAQAAPKAVTFTAAAEIKEKVPRLRIKKLPLIIAFSVITVLGLAGFYYWRFEYVGDIATADIDKLIMVSKGILRASSEKKAEAERIFTEAIVAYNTDSVNGYMNAYNALKRCISLDHHNPRYFAFLSESASELNLSLGDEGYLGESDKLSRRAIEMAPQNIDSLRSAAHYYHSVGKNLEALEYITKALAMSPADAGSHLLKARILSSIPGKTAEAEKAVQEALAIKELPSAYFTYGKIKEKEGDFQEAQNYYSKALTNQPDYLKPLLSSAEIYIKLGLYNDAESLLDMPQVALKKYHPVEQRQVYMTMASMKMESGKLVEARTYLEEALKLSRNDTRTFFMLGDISSRLGKFEESAGFYQEVIKLDPQNARGYYLLGSTFIKLRKYTQAIEKFKKAIELSPLEYSYHLGLGKAYLLSDQIDEGIAELKKAQEGQPKSAEVLFTLVDAYLQKGDDDSALEVAQRAVSLDPYSVDARLALSRAYEEKGSNQEAKAELEKVVKLTPEDGRAYTAFARIFLKEGNLDSAAAYGEKALKLSKDAESSRIFADVMERMGRLDDAISALQRAVEIEPYYFLNHYRLGEIYYKKKDFESALKSFQEAVSHKTTDVLSNYYIGRVLEESGKLDDAYSQYEKLSSSIDPKYAPAYFRMGVISEKKKDLAKAISKYQMAVDLDKTEGVYFYHLGKAQFANKDIIKAQENLENAVKLDEHNADYHLSLGMVYDYMGDAEKALKEYSQSFKLSRNQAEPLVRTANIYRMQGDYSKSMELLRQAMNIEPARPNIYYSLGLLNEEKGELEKAIANYKKALALKSDYPEPHYSLGFIYYKLGRNAEARENFLKSLSLGIEPELARKAKDALAKIPQN